MRASELLERLLQRSDLSATEAGELLAWLTGGEAQPAMAGALLAALRAKGVVADELRGFAQGMRALARRPNVPAGLRAIDIVGTGGDGSNSLNISTGTALLTAACGLPVLKHGNRSVSSRSGSADVLEALGLPVPLDEQRMLECLAAVNFSFLFAPHFHPAMKALAPVRSALGVRTVFNILGPLTNPAEPSFLLIGAFSLEVARLMADTLAGLGGERAFVVHGSHGWDEPTPLGPFTLFDVRPGRVDIEVRDPAHFGLAPCSPADLAGGDAGGNARALSAVLRGEDQGPHRDCLVLGTGLALEVSGRVRSLTEGMAQAAAAIESGAAACVVEGLARFGSAGAPLASTSAGPAAGVPT